MRRKKAPVWSYLFIILSPIVFVAAKVVKNKEEDRQAYLYKLKCADYKEYHQGYKWGKYDRDFGRTGGQYEEYLGYDGYLSTDDNRCWIHGFYDGHMGSEEENPTFNSKLVSQENVIPVQKNISKGPELLSISPATGTDTSLNTSQSNSTVSMLEVGQRYGGGTIFKLDETRRHGYIVSKYLGLSNFHQALDFCRVRTEVDGYNDWRLPTLQELKEINNATYKDTSGIYYDYGGHWTSEVDTIKKIATFYRFEGDGNPELENINLYTPNGTPIILGVILVRYF